ncbi:hypothetical protein POPTR_001G311400v4 [Populus trichocarpa]|uniref:Uncharacterized protein n=1 Tax=Populus trichocarpa TaxID=3694 RepID=A0ACC0TMC2_POPTR|nr:hypothetical protein POPTR_001G311400v4 [Populus trichocarpa]
MALGSCSVPFIAAYSSLLLGFVGLTWTSVGAGSIPATLFLACAVICGYVYHVREILLVCGVLKPIGINHFLSFFHTTVCLPSATTQLTLPLTNENLHHYRC